MALRGKLEQKSNWHVENVQRVVFACLLRSDTVPPAHQHPTTTFASVWDLQPFAEEPLINPHDHKEDVMSAVAVALASSPTSLTILLIFRAFFSARLSSEVRLWKCDVPFILLKSFLYLSCEGKSQSGGWRRGLTTPCHTQTDRQTNTELFVLRSDD